MNEPTGDATMKHHMAVVVARDNAAQTVTIETNHKEPQCQKLTLTANQCKGGLPGLFARGRVYCRIANGSVVWFFAPNKLTTGTCDAVRQALS